MVLIRSFGLRQVLKFVTQKPQQQQQFLLRSLSTTKHVDALYFTKKHEWVNVMDGDIGTIGISSYAQESLGDIVYAQLPNVDDAVTRGEECGALESVKAASELYSPVSGSVTEKNDAVEAAPSLINTSPMEDGWLFKVKLSDMEEVKELMDEESYKKYLTEHEE